MQREIKTNMYQAASFPADLGEAFSFAATETGPKTAFGTSQVVAV